MQFRGARRWLVGGATLGAVGLGLATAWGATVQLIDPRNPRYDADPDLGQLIPFVRERAQGRTLMVLSSNPGSAFPLVNYSGTIWGARFPHLWPLIAAYDSGLRAPGPLSFGDPAYHPPLAKRVRDMTVDDLLRRPPELLLVLRPAPDEPRWYARRFDYLEFFELDPRFAEWMKRYQVAGTIGKYDAFEPRGHQGRASPTVGTEAPE